MTPKLHHQRRGYVLVLTLGLLTLAAISLASLARFSLSLASGAKDAAEDLQKRWGLLSVQTVVEANAPYMLDAQLSEKPSNQPVWPKPSRVSVSFKLGNLLFNVQITDEDAKANLNAIHSRQPELLGPVLHHLCDDSRGLHIRVRAEQGSSRPFTAWGQVFDLSPTSVGEGRLGNILCSTTEQITCWGSGRLNLRRAGDDAVKEIASMVLPTRSVSELIALRRHWGGDSVQSLLSQLGLRRPQIAAATRLFAIDSRSYSTWVEVRNGQRSWWYQFVDDHGPVCFAW